MSLPHNVPQNVIDDEADFFTPDQSPVMSRTNSRENLQEDNEEIADQDLVLPRRSARANKGQTSRFQDYDLQHLDKATATKLPIILIDKEGENLNSMNNAAEVVGGSLG